MQIKVLIAEDHDFTRQSMTSSFKKYVNIKVIAEATTGQEAIDLAIQNRPDIILMDIGMPIITGIEATKEIKKNNPDIKVLIFTSHKEKENVLSSLRCGADAYCIKNIKIDNLVNIMEAVVKGAIWIDPEIANYILEIFQMENLNKQNQGNTIESKKADYNLTIREQEILKLIADGLNNKDISEKLFLSLYTVKNHVSNIIKKMSVEDRTQAAVIALKDNLL